ncbi:hypothetical protein BH09ACT6_BH09ACT6_26290 [soil metagenome]
MAVSRAAQAAMCVISAYSSSAEQRDPARGSTWCRGGYASRVISTETNSLLAYGPA